MHLQLQPQQQQEVVEGAGSKLYVHYWLIVLQLIKCIAALRYGLIVSSVLEHNFLSSYHIRDAPSLPTFYELIDRCVGTQKY